MVQVPKATGASSEVERLHRQVREAGAALGCEIVIPLVPRPRLQQMLLSGQADVMLPAVRDAERDGAALFVPMARGQLELVMRKGDSRRPADLNALVADTGLRGLLVRGQSWGGALDVAMGDAASSRVQRVGDFITVLRMLTADRADYSIVTASLFRGVAELDEVRELASHLEALPLRGLPEVEFGAYVSRAVGASDRSVMIRLLSSDSVRTIMHAAPATAAAPGPR